MGHTHCNQVCYNHAIAQSPNGVLVEADCLLLRASSDGDIIAMQEALASGASIEAQLPCMMRRTDADTISNLSGHVDPSRPAARSLTPLMYASDAGHLEAVKLLLSFHASLDIHEPDGMQALHFAAQSGSAACFRALLEAGANPLVKDDNDCDAMDYVPLAEICRGPMKQEWLTLLKDVHDSSLGAPCAGVAMAEEIDHQAVALPIWAAQAEVAAATTMSSLNKHNKVEATLPGIRGVMPSGSSSWEETLSETNTIS